MSSLIRAIKTLGTHAGTFHCDESLACYLLTRLEEFKDAKIIRSRDEEVLSKIDCLVDVGNLYDHEKLRYDHHQRGFEETFSPKYKIKLSSAGLIYRHYGRRVVSGITGIPVDSPVLETLYQKTYSSFVLALDALDNGVPQYPAELKPAYSDSTSLGARVSRLNPSWNETVDDAEVDRRFQKAIAMAGAEFEDAVKGLHASWLPARQIVEDAVANASKEDPSGQIIVLSKFAPWKNHFFDMQEQQEAGELKDHVDLKKVSYVVYPNQSGGWRVLCVPIHESSFVSRLPLLEQWRGLRDKELDALTGVPGGVFVHHSGFTGGHATKEGMIALIKKTIDAASSTSATSAAAGEDVQKIKSARME